MTGASDARFMALALALGRRGLGRVAPWPSVGCVIVKDGRIVGRGVSDRTTMRHAERVALDQAQGAAKGATVFVTLEPCAHQGNTPPCADALVKAEVARVVVATGDPNPQVAGQGLARLEAAGIAVETGLLEDRARADNAGFFSVIERRRPILTLKLATSLDGRIATATGESQWITGPDARAWVHGARARHDAVLVGAGTARADLPALTVRGLGVTHQPVRIVASRHLDLPQKGALFETASDVPVWLMHGPKAEAARRSAWERAGARCLEVAVGPGGQLNPAALLERLAAEGLTRVFCEGGGTLAAALLGADLVDELVAMTAGVALGAEGQPALGPLGVERLADATRLRLVELRRLGADSMARWVRRAPNAFD